LAPAEKLRYGAYVLAEASSDQPDLILIATGSEVNLVLRAQQKLEEQDIKTRVVSMPSWELFDTQSNEYRNSVLLPSVQARLAVEAGRFQGWHRYVGERGEVISVDQFGASAPGKRVRREYGFTVENVVEQALTLLEKVKE
jgi:transketolase